MNLKRWLFLAVLIGPLVVAFGALITGTLVWILWPLVVSVVLPGAIAAGVVAAKLPYFTAVGFFFGRELHRELGIPIGLVHSSWGGTVAEAWTATEVLRADPELEPLLAAQESMEKNHPAAVAKFAEQKPALLEKWKTAVAAAQALMEAGRVP